MLEVRFRLPCLNHREMQRMAGYRPTLILRLAPMQLPEPFRRDVLNARSASTKSSLHGQSSS